MLPIHNSAVPQIVDSMFNSTTSLNTRNDKGATVNTEKDSVNNLKFLNIPLYIGHSEVPTPVYRDRRASPSTSHKQKDTGHTNGADDSDKLDKMLDMFYPS